MKKKIKLEALKAESFITTFSNSELKTAKGGITGGCSDGCGPFESAWNCTRKQCSADCNTLDVCITWNCPTGDDRCENPSDHKPNV